LEANGLVAVDYSTGKSDPYCILEVDGVKQMTRARKRNLNPVWNETFVFGVQNAESKLQLTVMDQNKLEQDNFLAKLDVPLKDIANGIPVMGWFTLPTKGKIRLHMQFSHQFSTTSGCDIHQPTLLIQKAPPNFD
jgi:Ca2+-dependent lipid-binding protein